MKHSLFTLLVSVIILTIILAFTKSRVKDELIVHEWGTFTTLHDSKGNRLAGLYIEEEQLPSFVYEHPLSVNIGDELVNHKGPFVKPLNVTVKMETPVLYFYSETERKISVHVDFPKGIISQWYPERSGGDVISYDSQVDFKNDYKGWIEWNDVKVLAPNVGEVTSNPNEETKTWTTPRKTDANNVSLNGEIEKFLFYRGLGNFPIPVSMEFENSQVFTLRNKGSVGIPYVFVYEKKEDGQINVWWSGTLDKNVPKNISLANQPSVDVDQKFKEFENALISQGLYQKEAQAMLETWKASYFERPGFRVFWILPEVEVDKLLPLKITPTPTELKRVFVGRCDLLTPTFEQTLVSKFQENGLEDYIGDRYYLGFVERAKNISK